MAIYTKSPFERLVHFQEEVERLFAHFFRELFPPSPTQGDLLPRSDVFETDTHIFIEIELPGIKGSEIGAYITSDLLIVEGVKQERVESRVNYLCMERSFGKFYRVIELPKACDTHHLSAKLKNGILNIVLPKIEDRRGKRRKIAIEEESGED